MFSSDVEFSGSGLAEAIRQVRWRIVFDRWLRQWVTACNWIFVALIILAALLRFLRVPLVGGGIAVAGAALIVGLRAWYLRPSPYEAAQRLDAESRENDRISTAVHFWGLANPSAMILQQREDAVGRAAKLDAESFFPVRVPSKWQLTAALMVAFAALCAYHVSYGPPLLALKEKLMQSRALAQVLAPLARMLESAKMDLAQAANVRDTDAMKQEATERPGMPGLQPTADPMRSPSASSNPQKSDTSAENQPDQSGSSSSSESKLASLAHEAIQALQGLAQNAAGKQSSSPPPDQSPPPPGSNDANSTPGTGQANEALSGAPTGTPGSGHGPEVTTSASHGQVSAAGNSTPPWELQPNKSRLNPANLSTEHVPLESSGFRGPPSKERADVGGGTAAQVPLQNVTPTAVATVNGAGQDTVPARYRQYVRDYFESGKK
jgi:hypothetical protein